LMKLRIARGKDGKISHYDIFDIAVKPRMTVLDALFHIQDFIDPTISFRYSCRGAVCGSCGMLVDKVPSLACRVQLKDIKKNKSNLKPFHDLSKAPAEWDQESEVLIEPLPNFRILKDLIVDMQKFYDALESMKLWEQPADGESPRHQSIAERNGIERYVNCIMCALCFGSCPVNAEHEVYRGPAAIAKAFRFYKDSRTEDPERFLRAAQEPEAAPLCDLVMNCVKVCPKGVAPGGAIRKFKELTEG
jgi:succinate dehydrogenase / fumarate reductase iron-sulfur subunit